MSLCTCARPWLQSFRYGLHVILLWKASPRCVALFTEGMSRPFICSTSSGTLQSFRETDRLRFPLKTGQSQSQTQSQSYFTTGGLPPISSSWRQAP
jgi:hypothetical protein